MNVHMSIKHNTIFRITKEMWSTILSPLILEESKHKRVRVRTPLTPIHNEEFGQRKLQTARQLIDLLLQRSLRQRLVLIEQRHDHHRDNRHHKHREYKGKRPHVDVERLSPHFDNL